LGRDRSGALRLLVMATYAAGLTHLGGLDSVDCQVSGRCQVRIDWEIFYVHGNRIHVPVHCAQSR
jgi:hypothetical protein